MDDWALGLLGVVVGSAVTAAFGMLRDRNQSEVERRRQVQEARRSVFLDANIAITAVVEAASDFLESWHGHQPTAPQHDHPRLLRYASERLLNVAMLGSAEVVSATADLRRAVHQALEVEFFETADEWYRPLKRFHEAASSRLPDWQRTLRLDLGVD